MHWIFLTQTDKRKHELSQILTFVIIPGYAYDSMALKNVSNMNTYNHILIGYEVEVSIGV